MVPADSRQDLKIDGDAGKTATCSVASCELLFVFYRYTNYYVFIDKWQEKLPPKRVRKGGVQSEKDSR